MTTHRPAFWDSAQGALGRMKRHLWEHIAAVQAALFGVFAPSLSWGMGEGAKAAELGTAVIVSVPVPSASLIFLAGLLCIVSLNSHFRQ